MIEHHYYTGDCLFILNHDIPPNSVDLIYLDPPFFTGEIQRGKWQPNAMEISFEDSKKFWVRKEILQQAPIWLKSIGTRRPDFASYLYYMMERLQACRRVLKNSGSIYLHCDYRASHYLKMVMDEIFGYDNFQNEIVWGYAGGGVPKKAFARKHDTIFFFSKTNSDSRVFNIQFKEYGSMGQGKTWKRYNGSLLLKSGKHMEDWWNDVRPVIPLLSKLHRTREATGYPTQKPLALLDRIIKASSNEGDVVLDPFCGCGTTLVATYKLNRRFIGIDIHPYAFKIVQQHFRHQSLIPERIIYHERMLEEIEKLDPSDFEKWVNDIYKAVKPSPDMGVDGITKEGIPIQVKTNTVHYDIVDAFKNSATYHPKVSQPIKKMVIVSQRGFDGSARARAFRIEEKEDVKVELVEPKDIMNRQR